MQLGPPPSDRVPGDLADGLASFVTTLGQRPAVTVLGRHGRAEQGFVTLAQWAAKGSHLLLTDAFLTPGDAVLVDLPPGWPLAAVCAAVWWAGGTVVTDTAHAPAGVVAAVVHESAPDPGDVGALYVIGDAVDAGTTGATTGAAGAAIGSWAEEVQVFPDQPPPAAARPDLVAVRTAAGPWTHAATVSDLRSSDTAAGSLGIDLSTWSGTGGDAVLLVAARPLATGRTTLVLGGDLDRSAADGDRVGAWA